MVYEIKGSSYSVINYLRLRLINKSGVPFSLNTAFILQSKFPNLKSAISNLKSEILNPLHRRFRFITALASFATHFLDDMGQGEVR
jgi:hypothetical protein